MPPEIDEVLSQFESVSLDEMESVTLMDRFDTKFVLPAEALPEVLRSLSRDYRVLEVAGNRLSRYENVYFDTGDLALYHRHHAGRAHRWKIRARKYVESGASFFEVKVKTNRGQTVKRRLPTKDLELALTAEDAALLERRTGMNAAELRPSLRVGFRRITLVSRHSRERVTFDVGLGFRSDHASREMPGLVIVELKRERGTSRSDARDLLKALRVKPASVSKYCLGLILTHPGVRTNNFKERFRYVQRLSHAA